MLGHVNIWSGWKWTDVALTSGTTIGEGLAQLAHAAPGAGPVSPLPEAACLAPPTAGTGIRPGP